MVHRMSRKNKIRRLTSESADRLQQCIGTTGASDSAVCAIWNKAVSQPDERVNSATFKKHVHRALAPSSECFDRREIAAKDGSSVEIFIANIQKLIHFVGTEMPSLADLLADHLLSATVLSPVMYHDEAIASNPLSAEKEMKSMLVYLSWKELQRSLFVEDCWLPVCCVQHSYYEKLYSGFNGVMSLLVEQLLNPLWEIGFATSLIFVCVALFHIRLVIHPPLFLIPKFHKREKERVVSKEKL